jgi:tRNA threonylcarbamoyladenosine biosynthesis protein TsaE
MTLPAALGVVECTTGSPEATHALAASLAPIAEAGDLLCLWGELGAGKTVFAKGFGLGLGVAGTISSPSFVLMAEYPGRLPLFHLDLYRLADAADVLGGGLLDERQADGVTLIEWPDRLGLALPSERLDVRIDGAGEGERRIFLVAHGERAARYLEAARPFCQVPAAPGGGGP